MVPPSSLRIPRVRRYSGSRPPFRRFAYETITLSGGPSHALPLQLYVLVSVLTPGVLLPPVWPLPRSLAATCGIAFAFFSSAYLDVSVRRVPRAYLLIQYALRDSSSRWFPNSDICGSRLICSSPQLFAACHVLRRLLMPRHSPCALFSLNFSWFSCLSYRLDNRSNYSTSR